MPRMFGAALQGWWRLCDRCMWQLRGRLVSGSVRDGSAGGSSHGPAFRKICNPNRATLGVCV